MGLMQDEDEGEFIEKKSRLFDDGEEELKKRRARNEKIEISLLNISRAEDSVLRESKDYHLNTTIDPKVVISPNDYRYKPINPTPFPGPSPLQQPIRNSQFKSPLHGDYFNKKLDTSTVSALKIEKRPMPPQPITISSAARYMPGR